MSFAILILLIAAVVGSGGMVAVLAAFFRRIERLEGRGPDGGRLGARTAELQEQLETLQAEVDRLRDRVDFTEKLLERPRTGPGEPDHGGS